jgi:hypothetical protein
MIGIISWVDVKIKERSLGLSKSTSITRVVSLTHDGKCVFFLLRICCALVQETVKSARIVFILNKLNIIINEIKIYPFVVGGSYCL